MPIARLLAWGRQEPLRFAVPLTVAIALAGTADMIFREDVRQSYEANGDIAAILEGGASATPASILRWWTGVWIEASSPYYRPLASMLLYAEYLAFRGAWRGFCVVTWLMHAGVCVVMLFLLRRLTPGTPVWRVMPGLLAAALFSIPCETSVDGLHWGNRGIARGIMPYWPAQTDVGCLLLSLGCLLLLDRWLADRRRGDMAGAVACFVGALLFKEQAVIVPLLVAALALHRRLPLRVVALAAGVGVAASGLFLVLRRALVPGAWGPAFKGVVPAALKLAVYLSDPSVNAVVSHQWWILPSAVLITVCVVWAWRRPRMAVYAVLGIIASTLLPPQVLAGNAALVTVMPHTGWLVRVCLELLLLVVVWETRREAPGLLLLGCLLIVHLPILHVFGPHYYYWPVAWWSMLNATAVVAAVGLVRPARPHAEEADSLDPQGTEPGDLREEDRQGPLAAETRDLDRAPFGGADPACAFSGPGLLGDLRRAALFHPLCGLGGD